MRVMMIACAAPETGSTDAVVDRQLAMRQAVLDRQPRRAHRATKCICAEISPAVKHCRADCGEHETYLDDLDSPNCVPLSAAIRVQLIVTPVLLQFLKIICF